MSLLQRIAAVFSPRAAEPRPVPQAVEPDASKAPKGTIANDATIWSAVGTRIGESLTPMRVSQALRAADGGEISYLRDLLNEVRQKDAVIQCLLQIREKALTSAPYAIVPAETGAEKGSPEWTEAEEAAAFVRAAVDRCVVEIGEFRFGFRRAIAHWLNAIYAGPETCEVDWDVVDGDVVPVRLRPIGGRRLCWDERLRLCLADPKGDGMRAYPGLPLSGYQHKFVTHVPRVNGDEPIREGIGRLLLWYACFRLWSFRDWLTFAELYGKPWRAFVYDKDLADEIDVALAKEMARYAASSTGLAYPSSITAEVKWPDATGGAQASPSPAILQRCEEEMALAVIGQRATTSDVSNGLGGSGDARDLVRKDIRDGDELDLCDTIQRQLFAPMVAAKYGHTRFLPRLSLATSETPDLEKLTKALDQGVRLGARIPVTYLHEATGWPMAVGDEPILEAQVAQVAQSAGPAQEGGDEADEDGPSAAA